MVVQKQARADHPARPQLRHVRHDEARRPDEVARDIKKKFNVETVIVDANYRGAFSLGKSTSAISERFIRELLRDNPAGQDNEMTPFFLVRKA